eukprot:scaffold409430_cov42-Prasinocladus_malaysianus.AAC.1
MPEPPNFADICLEGNVQTLIVRARREHLVALSTPPEEVLDELHEISAELEAYRKQSISFHEHQILDVTLRYMHAHASYMGGYFSSLLIEELMMM